MISKINEHMSQRVTEIISFNTYFDIIKLVQQKATFLFVSLIFAGTKKDEE
jgi:hypothetical protein